MHHGVVTSPLAQFLMQRMDQFRKHKLEMFLKRLGTSLTGIGDSIVSVQKELFKAAGVLFYYYYYYYNYN